MASSEPRYEHLPCRHDLLHLLEHDRSEVGAEELVGGVARVGRPQVLEGRRLVGREREGRGAGIGEAEEVGGGGGEREVAPPPVDLGAEVQGLGHGGHRRPTGGHAVADEHHAAWAEAPLDDLADVLLVGPRDPRVDAVDDDHIGRDGSEVVVRRDLGEGRLLEGADVGEPGIRGERAGALHVRGVEVAAPHLDVAVGGGDHARGHTAAAPEVEPRQGTVEREGRLTVQHRAHRDVRRAQVADDRLGVGDVDDVSVVPRVGGGRTGHLNPSSARWGCRGRSPTGPR